MWAQGRNREGKNRKPDLCWQHTAQCRARTHELWDRGLSWNWMLNQLSHPGAPASQFLVGEMTPTEGLWEAAEQCSSDTQYTCEVLAPDPCVWVWCYLSQQDNFHTFYLSHHLAWISSFIFSHDLFLPQGQSLIFCFLISYNGAPTVKIIVTISLGTW